MEIYLLIQSSLNISFKKHDKTTQQVKKSTNVHRYSWSLKKKKCFLLWMFHNLKRLRDVKTKIISLFNVKT